jgi:lysophospholipase L1-like esterase
MKSLITILISLFSFCLQAQIVQKQIENYPFTNFDRNKIVYFSDSTSFDLFFHKLGNLYLKKEGNINIVHIGGSHVQAGVLTQQFRQNMQSLVSDTIVSKGLIFPFSAAKTNNPPSFKTRYTGKWISYRNTQITHQKQLGLTGIAICTNDSNATISISTKEQNKTQNKLTLFNKVTLLGYSTHDSLQPQLLLKDTLIQATHCKKSHSFVFNLNDYTDSITITLNKYEGEFTLTGILLENNLPGITTHGIGVNGASLSSFARCNHLCDDLKLINPDLMIFAIGINDATSVNFNKDIFISNYEKIIKQVLEVNPECALLFITNNDSFRRYRRNYQVNRNGEIVEKAFFQIAEKYNGAVWNLFDIMGGLRSMQQWEDEGLAKRDKIHFTKKGYTILGDLLYNALTEKFSEYLKTISNE